jgi:hypothetical protein
VRATTGPEPTSLAAASDVLNQWTAERDRLHSTKNLMPDDDTRLRKLVSDVDYLAGQIPDCQAVQLRVHSSASVSVLRWQSFF